MIRLVDLRGIYLVQYLPDLLVFYIENWISGTGGQTRNPFSHTANVKITHLKFYLRIRKFMPGEERVFPLRNSQ